LAYVAVLNGIVFLYNVKIALIGNLEHACIPERTLLKRHKKRKKSPLTNEWTVHAGVRLDCENERTLGHVVLLPRDAMRKRGHCCGPVSVRPSVTFVHSIKMAEDIVKLLCRPGSPIILVFFTTGADIQFQGNLFSGGAKYNGVVKICDF